jgi:hypothetical protein
MNPSATAAGEERSMPRGTKRLVALLASACAALLVACGLLLARVRSPALNTQAALADPELRAELVRRLTSSSAGVWDSHNDPEVGRVLQPDLTEALATGVLTRTNALGLRERDFALPKPAGTLRVVLLGDSFVQGFGVEAEERLGAFLERYLAEHARGWQGPIECLHVGVGGWNARAECAYLRRMLTPLAPDLVLHVLVTNDLDDQAGVRGFGALAAFAPLARERTDALVYHSYPTKFTSPRNTNYLLEAADFESRHRYEDAAREIGRLAALVRRSGGRYVAVAHWPGKSARLWRFLKETIEPKEFAVLPNRLWTDAEMILSRMDEHWSRRGHEEVARRLFTLIRVLDLLPQLALTPWPEAEDPGRAELRKAWDAAMGKQPRGFWEPPFEAVARLEPARFTELEWRHVHTGLDDEGRVSPFASFYLARKGQTTLRLRGRAFERPELAGAVLRASIEALPLGEHELVPGEPFDLRFPVPAAVKEQGGVTVRLETSDHVFAGADQQHCVSFHLDELALE